MPDVPRHALEQLLEPSALFNDYLTALADADAGLQLYELHAPDAPIRHGSGLRAASQVDATEFARSHRQANLIGQAALPQFGEAHCLSSRSDLEPARAVGWFQLTETREGRQLNVAVGFEKCGHAWRIGWCTAAASMTDWSYGAGLLQALAEYPGMRRSEPAMARVLLDASYFRLYWRAPVALKTLPGARFSCHMSGVCCRHDFEIQLPPEAQLLIEAMPWRHLRPELVATQLPVRSDGRLQLKSMNEACRFLGERGQCLIHQQLGRQPFESCSIFPFSFAQTPEGIAVALSPICPSVRGNLGVAPLEREADLRERLAMAPPRQAQGFRLAPDVNVTWEQFRDIEDALLRCLSATDYPLRRRLHLGARVLGAVKLQLPLDIPAWSTEPPSAITAELRAAILGLLSKIVGWDRKALRTLPAVLPSDLFALEVQDSEVVARLLQNTLFSKIYSYEFDLTTAHNFLIVLYLLTLVMQAASPGPMSEALWQELGSLGVHGLLKNVLHAGLPEGFREVLGLSDFGLWALSA